MKKKKDEVKMGNIQQSGTELIDLFKRENYQEYLRKWIDGITAEVSFWNSFLKTKGIGYSTKWDKFLSENHSFGLERYIKNEDRQIKLLDVGSGPFPVCGLDNCSKLQVEFHAVDALAYIYNALKKKYNVQSPVTPQYATLENLEEIYGSNVFDVVHIANALDHAFNPVVGICQLLAITKVGGQVILRHAINEAENEFYKGFHQWNLSIENSDFIIWRPNLKINFTELLKDYAEFFIEKKDPTFRCVVVLRKKQDLPLSLRTLDMQCKKLFEEMLFQKMSDLIMDNVKKREYYKLFRIYVKKFIFQNNYKKIAFFRKYTKD